MQESMDDIRALPSVTPQPCENAVSRQAVLDWIADYDLSMGQVVRGIHALPPVTPQEPKCKDCKWWKDSDGEYRRGCGAESICHINTDKVYQGEGYCYMFSPKADMRGAKE